MERAAGRQRCYSKALLSMLGLLLAALYFGFAGLQLVWPWQTAHQARFSGHLRQHSMAAAELAGAATALLSVGAVLSFPGHSWRKLLAVSVLLAVLQTVFWGVAIARVEHAEQAPLVGLPATLHGSCRARGACLPACLLAEQLQLTAALYCSFADSSAGERLQPGHVQRTAMQSSVDT